MKKICALCLCLVMVALLGVGGFAQPQRYYIIGLQGPEYRVKLRESPSKSSKIIGQYYSGVEMDVHAVSDDWAKVTLGGVEGYMMKEFLRPVPDNQWRHIGEFGYVSYGDETGNITVYSKADKKGEKRLTLANNSGVNVLGTVDDNWLHIACDSDGGSVIYGFISAWQVTKSENMAAAVIDGKKADEMVNIRKSPSKSGEIIGSFFSGTKVDRLFDNHTADDGWDKVRVGNVAGYILEEFLDYSSAGTQSFYPPLAGMKGDKVDLYDEINQSPTRTLGKYEAYHVLGKFGAFYQLRIETPFEPWPYEYGFVKIADMEKQVTKSPSTLGVLKSDQPLYMNENEQTAPTQWVLPKGSSVHIYSATTSLAQEGSLYIYPEAKWLYVEGITAEGSWISGYVDINEVTYDPGLVYPANMAVG